MITTPLTRDDVALVRALASLAKHQPASKRAGHLAARAEELAQRLETKASQMEQARSLEVEAQLIRQPEPNLNVSR